MMSTPAATSCVLVAELTGADALVEKLGAKEADRALERGRARVARAIEAYEGQALSAQGRQLVASFPRCDNAVLAAHDMRERLAQLPPVSGISLALRIGLHSGASDAESGRPTEATTDFANKLLAVATRDQILISDEVARLLPEMIRNQINTQAPLSVSANGTTTPVFELRGDVAGLRASQYNTPFMTRSQTQFNEMTASSGTHDETPPAEALRTRLMLRHQSASHIVSQTHPVLLAGREEGNDLVIADRRASRHHARIEWRDGHYMLIDTSTNGTYLVDDHGMEVILKRSECELPMRGRIGFGYSPQEIGVDVAMFDIGQK